MADWDVVGAAPAQVQNPWAVRSLAPAPEPALTAGGVAKGVGDAALSGVSKVATGVVGAPIALANRLIAALSGGDGQMAADAAHEYVNRTFGHDTQTPVGKHIGAAVQAALAPLGESANADKQLLEQGGQKLGLPAGAVSNQLSEAGDIAGTAGLAAPLAAGARASTEAADLAAQNAPAATPAARLAAGGWKMRPSDVAKLTPGGQPTMGGGALQSVVGDQAAAQAIGPQNALLAQQKAASATGIQLDQHGLIQPSAVADAKAPHAAVYEQMAGVPGDTTPDSYTQALQKIRSDPTLAPETQAAVDKLVDLHSEVGDSASASASIKTLRQKGSNLIGNDNPDFQDRGYAMKGISNALEDVLEQRATDSGQPELAAQFQQARKSYAQISNVEDASKAGMVDPQKLLRARDKGAPLTGPLADIANAAEQLPDVVRHQHSFSGGASDVPTTLAGAVQGILRNIGGRKILQGPYQQSLKGVAPPTGLGSEFDPGPQ